MHIYIFYSKLSRTSSSGHLTTSEHALPLVASCVRAHLHVVPPPSKHANIPVWDHHHHGALSPSRPRRVLLVLEWDLESSCGRPTGLRGGASRVVRERCLAKGDAGQSRGLERSARGTVSSLCSPCLSVVDSAIHRKRLFGDL